MLWYDYVLRILLDKSSNFCFAFAIKHEYDKLLWNLRVMMRLRIAGRREGVWYDKCHGIWVTICMYYNDDDNLSAFND